MSTPRAMTAYGTHANRPAANTQPDGARYTETDTGVEYINIAGTWTSADQLWTPLREAQVSAQGGGTAGTTFIVATLGAGPQTLSAASAALGWFYLDPAKYGTTGKARVSCWWRTNAVDPAANLTIGLYPVSTWAGASGAYPTPSALGTAVCSTTITTPGASARAVGIAGPVAFPAAGDYVIAYQFSTATAASSNCVIGAQIEYQQA